MTRTVRLIRAQQDLRSIMAAWSDETKAKITEEQLKRGAKIVEHELVDDFDLVLWENTSIPGVTFYVVSLNIGQYDPFDQELAKQSIPAEKHRKPQETIKSMVSVLERWIGKYGRLTIGSSNEKKFWQYLKLLVPSLVEKGLKVEHINEANPNLGVFLSR